LVGRTLETAVTGKEAATTLHHAYSAQVHVARVLDWSKAPAQAEGEAPSNSSPPKLDDCLDAAGSKPCRKTLRMFSGIGEGPRVRATYRGMGGEVAARLPRSRKQGGRVNEKIQIAIEAIERRRQIEKSGNSG
jgi:hypothetical protein